MKMTKQNKNSKNQLKNGLSFYDLKNFEIKTLEIDSESLKKNNLKDTNLKRNIVLVPREITSDMPIVFYLAGFMGNGTQYFNTNELDPNLPQVLDDSVTRGEAPLALYIFVDGMSSLGGTQFINSKHVGNYEDYIVHDLWSALHKTFGFVTHDPKKVCVTGGSSGGYGALWLASSYPEKFGVCAALAPDSYFEVSLLPELRNCLTTIEKLGGVAKALDQVNTPPFKKQRNWRDVQNVLAMTACYSGGSKSLIFPVDLKTGEVKLKEWEKWLQWDPIVFLKSKKNNLKKLHGLCLHVGVWDEFQLHLGARIIHRDLIKMKIKHDYVEYDGGHFDMRKQRPEIYKWLNKIWK